VLLIGWYASCYAAESSEQGLTASPARSTLPERVGIRLYHGTNIINKYFNLLSVGPYADKTLGKYMDDNPCVFASVMHRSTSTSTKTRRTMMEGRGLHANFDRYQGEHPHLLAKKVRYYLTAKAANGNVIGIFLGTGRDACDTQKVSDLHLILAGQNVASQIAAVRVFTQAGLADEAASFYERTLASADMECKVRWQLLSAIASNYFDKGQEEKAKEYAHDAAASIGACPYKKAIAMLAPVAIRQLDTIAQAYFPASDYQEPGCFIGY
jgi:hypothetical protein